MWKAEYSVDWLRMDFGTAVAQQGGSRAINHMKCELGENRAKSMGALNAEVGIRKTG
jgi:hypothetical protein